MVLNDDQSAGRVEFRKVDAFADLIDAVRLRVDVFIVEQKCRPGWEPDEEDKVSDHYVAIEGGKVVGAARLRADRPNSLKVERMVVRKEFRSHGIGLGLTRYIVAEAVARRPSRIWLEAQSHATEFYERAGFRTTSAEYDPWDLGIPHVEMEYAGPLEP